MPDWARAHRWRQWTLRTRLVVAIAALAAIGLLVTDVAGLTLLHNQLIRQVDDRLGGVAGMARGFQPVFAHPRPSPVPAPVLGGEPFTVHLSYDAAGVRQSTDDYTGTDLPILGTLADLRRHAASSRPYTVDGTEGPWRVAVAARVDGSGYEVLAVPLGYITGVENKLVGIDAAVSALVLLLIAFAAATVVRIGLRPLTRMELAAAGIAAGDLSRRVADADPHTESGRLGTALNAMLVQIESALAVRTASERRMRQFLADASHELRTPLTSIQGFAELYRRGGAPPGPELDEAMGRIEVEVGRMRLLVSDLLLLARLDEERPLVRRPVDLLEVAADAVSDAHVRVPTRFVLLDGIGPLEPVTVLADEARIRQVVTNLLANALQHTPDEAEVVVRVGRPDPSAEPPPVAEVGRGLGAGTPLAAIEVADSGPGMSTVDATRVFERLYRAEQSRARSHGGAGLGLSIVAAIVAAHGGSVQLWTAPGRGARFRVLLPVVGH
ncbi:MAG TPA: HAMP domain-containing sensor histidine kinase [Rugosimonospora sp.]|nr:HAMP domain-containing sensor histidine kinase [Rugosimonospora sp.]